MITKRLFLLVVLFSSFPPQSISAQTAVETKKGQSVATKNNQANESFIKLGFSEIGLVSNFASPTQKRQKLYPSANAELWLERPKGYLDAKAQYSFQNLPTIAVSVNAGRKIAGTKKIHTSIGFRYLFSRQYENVLNQTAPPITIGGATGKQKVLLDISENFSPKAVYVRFSLLTGAVQFSQKASFSMDGRRLNAGKDYTYANLLFFTETRFIGGAGISFTIQPFKQLKLSANGERYYMPLNPTRLMPSQQYQASLEIAYIITQKIGISINGLLSNAGKGAAVLPNGLSSNIIIKF